MKARIAAGKAGEIPAFEMDHLTGIGPCSMFPRTIAIGAIGTPDIQKDVSAARVTPARTADLLVRA